MLLGGSQYANKNRRWGDSIKTIMADKTLELEAKRTIAVDYIKRFFLKPYIYGGQGPDGWCCSGLIVAVLRGIGWLKTNEDLSADGLYKRYHEGNEQKLPYAGCLVFWFKNGRAYHVAMLIDNFYIIEAGGGDADTQSAEDAARDDAMVRMRPIDYRGKRYKIIDPFKG